MPRFRVQTPSGSPLAQEARIGGQVMADAGDGAVEPAKLVEESPLEDGSAVLTFEASKIALAIFFEDERYEVTWSD